jgi:hypothetical protein
MLNPLLGIACPTKQRLNDVMMMMIHEQCLAGANLRAAIFDKWFPRSKLCHFITCT